MLQLKNITKTYVTGDTTTVALNGVSLDFRNRDFVSILGPSGCGKTTLLNIIGGLDRYDSGDLLNNGISTQLYSGRDWDSYRNGNIGFVFQSYNLIPHQTVLANVELALTVSGMGKSERRQRAADALRAVGLETQMKKRPGQMSGGQMQRVAIARALVNNPDIVLADEPTGALDTETSRQIMEILKEVAKDRLVIMVTHNPELAGEYSTRIVRMLDGKISSDSNPVTETEIADADSARKQAAEPAAVAGKSSKGQNKHHKRPKRVSMSFFTAISLSFKNLMSKKARTILTSVAGSIGIIGIALVLSVQSGFQAYINRVQEDMLASYPLSFEKSNVDMISLIGKLMRSTGEADASEGNDKVYTNAQLMEMAKVVNDFKKGMTENDLAYLKRAIETGKMYPDDPNSEPFDVGKYLSAVQYVYNPIPYIVNRNPAGTAYDIWLSNPNVLMTGLSRSAISGGSSSGGGGMMSLIGGSFASNIFVELLESYDDKADDYQLIKSQYNIVDGRYPTEWNELVLVLDKNNKISDLALYALGVKDPARFRSIYENLLSTSEAMTDEEVLNQIEREKENSSWNYDELLALDLYLLVNTDFYTYDAVKGQYIDTRPSGKNEMIPAATVQAAIDRTKQNTSIDLKLKVVGILKPKADATAVSIGGSVGYTKALTEKVIELVNKSAVVTAQLGSQDKNLLTGMAFLENLSAEGKRDLITDLFDNITSKYKLSAAQLWVLGEIGISRQAVEDILSSDLDPNDPNDLALVEKLMKELTKIEGYTTALKASTNIPDDMLQVVGGMNILLNGNGKTGEGQIVGINERLADPNLTERERAEIDLALDGIISQFKTYGESYGFTISYDTRDEALEKLGYTDLDKPTSIKLYPKDFKNKEAIIDSISKYNEVHNSDGKSIDYTDYIGLFMSSVSTVINIISIVLIAFVSISLVVSSIMIGIITYISVLERTKEIGILRSIGASKSNVSGLFVAETMIIGAFSGLIGIVTTLILNIPVNKIIQIFTKEIANVAKLPLLGAVVLIGISILLTLIGGLIPSIVASKKDPVVALRSE